MYGAPVQPKPDLTGWKLVSDQAFFNGVAVGLCLGVLALFLVALYYGWFDVLFV